ncbi:MAG: hypothetical protein LBC19_09190, partial [Tannerella sp.]|nr:hypothetical protein [Tannerella sp.]
MARKFISAIIGEEVAGLTFAPQEYVRELENVPEKSWSFYRLDFNAQIRIGDTQKSVMIEVQKVSLNTDVMRFRRYMISSICFSSRLKYSRNCSLERPFL